ncbi:MAG: deoxyribodipyrimidine photo-lyase, partial [Burkholderiaceae bacterium]
MTANASKSPSALSSSCQLVWLRRDLRLEDHAALSKALQYAEPIVPVFVFDRDILDGLPTADRRVAFLHETLGMLQAELVQAGGGLLVVHGRAHQAMPALAKALGAVRVICAEDYEPRAIERDQAVAQALAANGIDLVQVQDQCVFAKQ